MSWLIPIIGCCCRKVWKLTPCYEPGPCDAWISICGRALPNYLTLHFEGITPLSGCQTCGGTGKSWIWNSPPDVDDIICVVGPLTACIYAEVIDDAAATFIAYPWSTTCGGSSIQFDDDTRIVVTARFASVDNTLRVFMYWQSGEVPAIVATAWLFGGHLTITKSQCASPLEIANNQLACSIGYIAAQSFTVGQAATGGQCTVTFGDIAGGGPCPGGDPVYVTGPLGPYEGGVIKLAGVWYAVEDGTGHEPEGSIGAGDIQDSGESCAEECT